jgi:hypothetical protein
LEPSSFRRAGAAPKCREAASQRRGRNEAPAEARPPVNGNSLLEVVLRARHGGPTGVEEGGIGARGFTRNLGGLTGSEAVKSSSGIAEARDDRDGARRRVRSRSSS